MKINVPQEQELKIVELYKQGFSRKKIKDDLQLSFGDSVIKRILIENHCEIRSNPGAKKGGRKKDIVDEKIQQQIIELYKQGYGQNYISQQIQGISGDKIKRILKENNIPLRNYAEAIAVKYQKDTRKYKINDDYNFNSHNGAWILGFLVADGYLPNTKGAQNRVVLTLSRIDENVLYAIKEELNYEGPIYQFNSSNGFPASSLTFTSKKLRQAIESYGIINNKTFKLKQLPSNLSEEFMIDFIRGFFDGDGSICSYEKEKKINLNFTCASKEFLQSIEEYLYNKYPISKASIHEYARKHIIYEIRYYKKDSIFLGNKFYNHNYLSLPRKKEKFFELLEKFPLLRK